VFPGHFGQPVGIGRGAFNPVQAADLLFRVQVDIRGLLQAAHKVLRHGLANVGPAIDDVHLLRCLGEEHRPLAGRVARADDGDGLPAAKLGLHGRCAIIDAAALIALQVLDWQLAILRARGNDDGAGLHPASRR